MTSAEKEVADLLKVLVLNGDMSILFLFGMKAIDL